MSKLVKDESAKTNTIARVSEPSQAPPDVPSARRERRVPRAAAAVHPWFVA